MFKIKFLAVVNGLLLLCTSSMAQKPSQDAMLKYIQNKTMIFYIPNDRKPELNREIKPASIENKTGNIIFGETNNNKMDVSAVLLRDLFTLKNGDPKFQETIYDLMQKLDFPIVLFFINDVAVSSNIEYLRKNGVVHYEVNGRQYVWPATYKASDVVPQLKNRWAFVFGEYFNKSSMIIKEGFIDLLTKMTQGNIGQASQSIFRSQDGVTIINKTDKDITKLTTLQLQTWILADKQLGVIGSDWDGPKEIGTAPVERTMELPLKNIQVLNFWYPNVRKSDNGKAWKRTMIGTMQKNSEHYENGFVFPDYDINIFVKPNKDYEYLIKESPAPNSNFLSKMGNITSGDLPNCPAFHDHVEAEIDLNNVNEKQFVQNFNEDMIKAKSAGFFGVWMYDRGHCDHPEIHPAEQIWWRYETLNGWNYHCNLICDYSGRYNMESQYDDEDDMGKYTIMKPWAQAPIKGIFAIPFVAKPGQRVLYRIFQHDYNNLNSSAVRFDKNKVHHFNLNGKTVVTVVEPDKDCLSISFEQVGYDPAGNLAGFVVIKSAVGTLNNGKTEPGHLFLEVKKSILEPKTSQTPPGKVKISLETIQCTGYDDGGGNNAEEIIGKIFCKALAVKDTVSYRSQRLNPIANTAGALCDKNLETLLCITCPNWTTFGYFQLKTYTSSFTYDFPADGYIEVTGDLDEADSDDCRDLDYLGQPQKTYILTSELGTTPMRFTQYFASGKTIIKVNYMVQKVK